MNIVFMSMDTLPSTLWARDLYDQMHIRSDFRKWFPRMCQYGFIEGRDYEYGVMSNVRFDELELMLMAMFEQPTLRDTIQVLTEVQPLVAEDAEMSALVQQTIPKMQQLNEQQFKGLELEWHRPEEPEKEKT